MEHRWSKRRRTNLSVTCYHRGKALCGYKVKNISPDGMYIQASIPDLHDHVIVELEIATGHQRGNVRVQAMMVHYCNEGTGLMFLDRLDMHLLDMHISEPTTH